MFNNFFFFNQPFSLGLLFLRHIGLFWNFAFSVVFGATLLPKGCNSDTKMLEFCFQKVATLMTRRLQPDYQKVATVLPKGCNYDDKKVATLITKRSPLKYQKGETLLPNEHNSTTEDCNSDYQKAVTLLPKGCNSATKRLWL